MMQSFNTQLQVSLRALREVVAPAMNAGEKHAVEQLHLVMATLEFARLRLPYARRYYRLELENYTGLADQVLAVIGIDQRTLNDQLRAAAQAGRAELARPEAELEDYVIVTRQLRELIGAAVPAAIGKPCEQALDVLIVQRQKDFLLQQRAWCLPLGFEPRPDELTTTEDLLDQQ